MSNITQNINNHFIISQTNLHNLPNMILDKRISFVYIDYYKNYTTYLNMLYLWFTKIKYLGLIMGSRYINIFDNVIKETNNNIFINSAVDKFALDIQHIVLATFHELKHDLDDIIYSNSNYKLLSGETVEDMLPAWYMFKIKIIR
jgi:hypothetical protein